MENNSIRLQKFLSECGVASRRKAEELIEQGKVKINGETAKIGDKINPRKDIVTMSGKKIKPSGDAHVYIMLHKPRGFVTTMSDEMGRRCVNDLVADLNTRVYPVGRLDKDSEGLLIMTNDGEFANNLMHPKGNISKVYRVTVRNAVKEEQVTALAVGVLVDDRMTAPAEIHVIEKKPERSVLEIILHEGRNRQIRKMCEATGLDVIRLKRTAIGKVKLGMLPQGKWRELTSEEIKNLSKK